MEFTKPAEFVEFLAKMGAPCVMHALRVGDPPYNSPYYYYYPGEVVPRQLNILTGAVVTVGDRETILNVILVPQGLVPEGWYLTEGKQIFRRETRKMDMIQTLLDSGVPKEDITKMRKTCVSTLREVCDNSAAKQRKDEETLTISELGERVTTKGMVETFKCEEFGEITIEISSDKQNSTGLVFDFTVDWEAQVDAWIQELTDAMSTTELSLYDGVLDHSFHRR